MSFYVNNNQYDINEDIKYSVIPIGTKGSDDEDFIIGKPIISDGESLIH